MTPDPDTRTRPLAAIYEDEALHLVVPVAVALLPGIYEAGAMTVETVELCRN